MSAIALLVNYYTDRFSLMRSWKRAPHVSTEISHYSRKYFFSLACIFLAVMSSYYWAAYPFDNLCPVDREIGFRVTESYRGLHELDTKDVLENDSSEYNMRNITIDANTAFFRYCNQDYLLRPQRFYFPFTYREGPGGGEWMTEDQKKLSIIYGWAAVAILGMTGAKFALTFLQWLYSLFVKDVDVSTRSAKQGGRNEVGWKVGLSLLPKSAFFSFVVLSFQARGDDQGINFHEVRNISGYIPQVRSGIFSYPLIVCRVAKLDETIFDWYVNSVAGWSMSVVWLLCWAEESIRW
jgi:hypothetical protein